MLASGFAGGFWLLRTLALKCIHLTFLSSSVSALYSFEQFRFPRLADDYPFDHFCDVAGGEIAEAGWVDRNGLNAVCRSFGDAPETATHPSGRRRCASLDRCFAAAEARASPRQVAALKASMRVAQPRLVSGPQLVRTGYVR